MKHTRAKVQFKVNNIVVFEEFEDLMLEDVEYMKTVISQEFEVEYGEIEVEYLKTDDILGDYDVNDMGIIDWKSCYFTPFEGVCLELKEGSDAYLDAVSNGNLEKYLHFY